MRLPFRFFRGELNGFFVYTFCTFLNVYAKITGLLDEMVYHMMFQWKLPYEAPAGVYPIRNEDVYNLGKIGGLFQPRTFLQSNLGSIWFTESFMSNGVERSERGLLDMEYESFLFVRTGADEYPTDINTQASEMQRSTLVEHGAVPLGYVREGVQLFDEKGEVIRDNLIPLSDGPPAEGAYVTYYGLKYLIHEEFFDRELPLTVDVFKLLFEAMQRIRRNGASIISLLEITSLLGEGYIYDLEIQQEEYWYNCYYSLNADVVIVNRERRYVAWLNVLAAKFKHFNFIIRSA